MSKLLETRLPLAAGESASSDTFNRLIRVLELNLGAFDPDISPHFTNDEIDTLQFSTGAIIFNTTNDIHQAFVGTRFRNLYEHQTYPTGVSMTASVGSGTVTTC